MSLKSNVIFLYSQVLHRPKNMQHFTWLSKKKKKEHSNLINSDLRICIMWKDFAQKKTDVPWPLMLHIHFMRLGPIFTHRQMSGDQEKAGKISGPLCYVQKQVMQSERNTNQHWKSCTLYCIPCIRLIKMLQTSKLKVCSFALKCNKV